MAKIVFTMLENLKLDHITPKTYKLLRDGLSKFYRSVCDQIKHFNLECLRLQDKHYKSERMILQDKLPSILKQPESIDGKKTWVAHLSIEKKALLEHDLQAHLKRFIDERILEARTCLALNIKCPQPQDVDIPGQKNTICSSFEQNSLFF